MAGTFSARFSASLSDADYRPCACLDVVLAAANPSQALERAQVRDARKAAAKLLGWKTTRGRGGRALELAEVVSTVEVEWDRREAIEADIARAAAWVMHLREVPVRSHDDLMFHLRRDVGIEAIEPPGFFEDAIVAVGPELKAESAKPTKALGIRVLATLPGGYASEAAIYQLLKRPPQKKVRGVSTDVAALWGLATQVRDRGR